MTNRLIKVLYWPALLAFAVVCFSLPVQAQLNHLEAPAKSEGAWAIETLQVSDNQAYYQAYISSLAMLQRTLGWGWPSAKQTPEGNQDTMRFHAEQHAAQRAFSYVIREADHRILRGALFINPVQARAGLPDFSAHNFEVEVTFWLNKPGQDAAQAEQLVTQITDWLVNDWGVRRALFPVARSNEFARQQLELHGFELVTEDRNNDEILYAFRAR